MALDRNTVQPFSESLYVNDKMADKDNDSESARRTDLHFIKMRAKGFESILTDVKFGKKINLGL